MLRTLILAFTLAFSTAALAQGARTMQAGQPTADDIMTQYLSESGQLRVSLSQARSEIKMLKEQLKKLEDEKAKAEADKPEDKKTDAAKPQSAEPVTNHLAK